MHQVPYRTGRSITSEGRNDRSLRLQQQQQQQKTQRLRPRQQQPSRFRDRASRVPRVRARVCARARTRRLSSSSSSPSSSSFLSTTNYGSGERTTTITTTIITTQRRSRRHNAGPDADPRRSSSLHCLGPVQRTLYGGAPPLLPSNLLLIGLALCCLALPAVQPRLSNHHQTCPGCPHQQPQHHHHHHAQHEGPARGGNFKDTAPTEDSTNNLQNKIRLEAIKLQILQKLGLRTRPDINRTLAAVPLQLALETLYRSKVNLDREYQGEFLYERDEYLYRNLDQEATTTEDNARTYQGYKGYNEDELDDFYARTSEIITFAEPGRTLNSHPLLEFTMSSSEPALEPLRIKRAILWTRVELKHVHQYQHHRHSQYNQRNITLWVFRVHCGNRTHLQGKELGQHLEMVTSLVANVGQLGWQKFDVTKVVSEWYMNSTDKLTLLVDCSGCGSRVHVSTFDGHSPHVIESSLDSKDETDPDNRPFLVVRTDPAAVKRVRRRAIECNDSSRGQCCKQKFYVSFRQLGWDDWIIAPPGYYANYCRGDCAAGHRTPDTFLNYYTHVIEEYRKMDRLVGMQPCCAPLKFSPMSLIYYGPDSNIIKRDLPKMVVDECGCP